MTSGSSDSVWRRFEHDPRDPSYAALRASDRDRAVVHDVLAEAYAEGRLDREELEERTAAVDAAKTYAALVPPIRDLAVDTESAGWTSDTGLRQNAETYYRERLREAFFGFLIPNLIVWAIWFMTGHDAFIWPVFVTIPTAANLARVASSRQTIIQARVDKLERRRARALEQPAPTSPDPDSDPMLRQERERPEGA